MSENPYQPPATLELRPAARARLLPVAVSLLVLSLLWIFMSLFGIAFFVGQTLDPEMAEQGKAMLISYILYLGISILYSLLLCSGAFSMIRRSSYVWAVVTNCLACVPMLGPCYFLAVPIGIWGLSILRDKEVRASFSQDTLLERVERS
jgi:hypothetical protein